jgi:hypothetical protein
MDMLGNLSRFLRSAEVLVTHYECRFSFRQHLPYDA